MRIVYVMLYFLALLAFVVAWFGLGSKSAISQVAAGLALVVLVEIIKLVVLIVAREP